jgi:tetratricopeptide (TPR) repeat protein
MKTNLVLLALALLVPLQAQPAAPATDLPATTEAALERAYLRASSTSLAEAVKPFDTALAADPKNPALLYTRAFAHYAAVPALRAKNDKAALQSELEAAAALLERVKGQPWEGEAAALHGGILGQLIGVRGGMSGMVLGPKSSQLLGRAEKALPGNPRVLLFRGISLFNTPAAFGGDAAKGTLLLQQSADAFVKADAASPGPHWGRADALTWGGRAQHTAGDLAAARAAWEQALALEPDYVWVKFALLPSLDQKKAP